MTVEQTRWMKHRMACERWKRANYAYYLAQKRECAHRPEYLAHRREMYARSKAGKNDLSTKQISLNGNSEANETTDRQIDSGAGTA